MSKKFKILLADDEPSILEILEYNLKKEGFIIKSCADGKQALALARTFVPDLILLDIMMPIMDGIEACRQLRQIPALNETYIVFLTARSEEYSEIAAFDAGASDFINKPIKPRALISRVSAIFRRGKAEEEGSNLVSFPGFSVNKDSYTVIKGEEKIPFTKKEFELLFFLCQHPNKVFNREDILNKIWGDDVCVVSRTIDVHIRKIREKIGDKYITTIKGIGYKFEC